MPIVSLSDFVATEFDYVIVGGGTAGIALAARLSEDPDTIVGVLEAGTHDVNSVPQITVPGLMGSTLGNPTYDWCFRSTPQRHAHGERLPQPRGKGLGGSSLINFMGMSRPSKEEYDALEKLGNPGWNWESMLGYMKKSENTAPPTILGDEAVKWVTNAKDVYEWNGQGGPIWKTFPTLRLDVQEKLFDVFEDLGLPRNPDGNNGVNVGASSSFTSIDPRTKTRCSAYTAYYEPCSKRKNLLVLCSAHVTKVLLTKDDDNGLQRAVGVGFTSDSDGPKTSSIQKIRKDVVLSAGSFQTPQLLELSGIGNPSILEKFGIESKIVLPGVGENLQDHVCIRTFAELHDDCETVDELREIRVRLQHDDLYEKRQGLLTSISAVVYGYAPARLLWGTDLNDARAWKEDAPVSTSLGLDESLRLGREKQYALLREWCENESHAVAELINYAGLPDKGYHGITPVPGKRYTALTVVLMHPLSRGTVHVSSSDPRQPPDIDPNYFENEADLNMLLKALRFTLKVYESPILDGAVKKIIAPAENIRGSDPKLREWIRSKPDHVFHPVGTAAMMPKQYGGVVDSRLKVYGTSNLRVADCSILPLELSCHTQSAAYAIAEKAHDILREDNKR